MSRASKSELSKSSRYYVPRNRYHELRYFCLQFHDWERRQNSLIGLATRANREPTDSEAFEKIALENKIKMVTFSAEEAGHELSHWILVGVTTGLTYGKLNAPDPMPCGRELYYSIYRKFFYILDRIRD